MCPRGEGAHRASPASPHKLQSVPWEHGSSRGVDGFGGFKLVPGSWKKENKPAETWQGTGLHPGPEGDDSPIATGTRCLAAQEEGTGRRRRVPGSALCYSTGEVMAGSPAPPHALSLHVLLVSQSKLRASPHHHLSAWAQLPSLGAQGLEVTPSQG